MGVGVWKLSGVWVAISGGDGTAYGFGIVAEKVLYII